MKKQYETGDIFINKLTKDKVVVLSMIPYVVKVPNESPNLHQDDYIGVTDETRWEFVENKKLEDIFPE